MSTMLSKRIPTQESLLIYKGSSLSFLTQGFGGIWQSYAPRYSLESPSSTRYPGSSECVSVTILWARTNSRLHKRKSWPVPCCSHLLCLLPGWDIIWRLKTVIHQEDRALARLAAGQLNAQEVKSVCYLRGLNCTHTAEGRCWAGLGECLQISCSLTEMELSLLLHDMAPLSTNYLWTRHEEVSSTSHYPAVT